jgi:hypothetical protein
VQGVTQASLGCRVLGLIGAHDRADGGRTCPRGLLRGLGVAPLPCRFVRRAARFRVFLTRRVLGHRPSVQRS